MLMSVNLHSDCNVHTYLYSNNFIATVLLNCNVALTCIYFPRISILDTLLSTGTHTNSTRVERGVEADVKDLIG